MVIIICVLLFLLLLVRIGWILLPMIASAFMIALMIYLFYQFFFQNKKEFLLKVLRNGMIFFIAAIAAIAALISTNFTKYFVIFHKEHFKIMKISCIDRKKVVRYFM